MRASFIVALGLSAAASVSATALFPRDYPACADPCLTGNINYFGCNSVDFTCLCTNHQFLDASSQCLYDHCSSPADLEQAVQTADAICKAAGVTITSTYTPTQSRSQTASQTTSVSASITSGGSTTTSAPTSSKTSSAPASTTSNAAAARFGSSGAYAMVGAAVLGALAL